jgi:hypothetical protein
MNPKNLNIFMIENTKNKNKVKNEKPYYNLPYVSDIIDDSQGGYLRAVLI